MGERLPEQFLKYFISTAYLYMLTTAGVPIGNVTFEPGCHNNWHIHRMGGQILLVTGGRGWCQFWGELPRSLHPGDVVEIPVGIKHWHGVAKGSWFSHLSVEIPAEGAANDWLEPLTDEEYNRLK